MSNLFFQLRHLYDFLHSLTGLWRQVPSKPLRSWGEDRVGGGGERDCFLQHVAFVVIGTNQTPKPLSEWFVGFCCLFVCRMRSTRCVTEVLFGIKCPFHFSSSNQTCLIREPVYSTHLWYAALMESHGTGHASSKILLLHAHLCCGLSQPLLLLSHQPHYCTLL